MLPIHTRQSHPRQTPPASVAESSGYVPQFPKEVRPATHFQHYEVIGNGDCLFRAVYLGLANGELRDNDIAQQDIDALRGRLSAYLNQYGRELMAAPCFDDDVTFDDLGRLASTPGAWNNACGDLVPLFLAHILGRELKIMQPVEGDPHTYLLRDSCVATNAHFPAVAGAVNSGPPLYLLQKNLSHYTYLKPQFTAGEFTAGGAGAGSHSSPDQSVPVPETAAAINTEERLASEALLSLLASADHSSHPVVEARPVKKPKLATAGRAAVKVNVKAEPATKGRLGRIPQPLLVPTVLIHQGLTDPATISWKSQLGQRFYVSSRIDLTGARPGASSAAPQEAGRVPVSLIPDADLETMSRRPIFQDLGDPNQADSRLPQPTQVNSNISLKAIAATSPRLAAMGVPTAVLKAARNRFHHLLQHPQARQAYEHSHFGLTKITAANLPEGLAPDHPTVGMRGVIAQQPLAQGSPLQYSGQYLSLPEWDRGVAELSQILQDKAGFDVEAGAQEAERAMGAYAWGKVVYKSKKYDISAFGAGNVASMINHDSQRPNMGAAYFSALDSNGQATPKLMVYFALRDIAEGEQLLVDYGDAYSFDPPAEGEVRVSGDKPGHISRNLSGLVKAEPVLTARIGADWGATEPSVLPLPEALGADLWADPVSSDDSSDNDGAIAVPRASIATLSIGLLPDAWREPPAGYSGKSDPQQLLVRCDYRERIRQFYQDNKREGTVLPNRLVNEQFPDWCQPRVALEKWQEPPPAYSTLDKLQRSLKRKAGQDAVRKYNKNKPPEDQVKVFKWCAPAKGLRLPSVESLMQPPSKLGKVSFSSKKYKARANIDKHNLNRKREGKDTIPYPEWMRVTPRSVRGMDRQAVIDMCEHPPADYDQLTDKKKACLHKKVRGDISRYNEAHPNDKALEIPMWCRKTVDVVISPAQYDKDTLPCPEKWTHPPSHYHRLQYTGAALVRRKMREEVDSLNQERQSRGLQLYRYAEWFKRKPFAVPQPIERYMQPPENYHTMPKNKKSQAKKNAQSVFSRHNEKLKREGQALIEMPSWCRPKRELTAIKTLEELMERPDSYPSMSQEEQAVLRAKRCTAIDQHNALRAEEGKPPVDYADWMKEIGADTNR